MTQSAPRYVPLKELLQVQQDRLFLGDDLTLRRPVLIYAVPREQARPFDTYLRTIDQAATELTRPTCLHLLDIENQSEWTFILLHYKPGRTFRRWQQVSSATLGEKLRMIARFGQVWQKAEKELGAPLPLVSLEASNLWVTEDDELFAINSWDRMEPGASHPIAQSLSRLLGQLLLQRESVPADYDAVATELRWTLNEASGPNAATATQAEDLSTVLRHGWTGQLSLTAFVTSLLSIAGGGGLSAASLRPAATAATPAAGKTAEPRAAAEEPRPRPDKPAASEAAAAAAGVPAAEAAPLRSSSASPAAAQAGAAPPAEAHEASHEGYEEEEAEPQASWLVRFGKKAAWSLSIAVASLLVFAGVLTVLIQSIDLNRGGGSEASSTAPKGSATPPTATSTPAPTATPSNTPAPTPKPSSTPIPDIVTTPNLVGMTQQAAEQQARDSGLRYSYFLEPSDKPAGTVFKQDLQANQQIAKGERITFWISKGR